MYYTQVSDDGDGHDFIIPYDKLDEWYDYLEHCDEMDLPEWANPIEGMRVVFTSYQLR